MQIRLRTLFALTLICCIVAFGVSYFRDYINIRLTQSNPNLTEAELAEIDKDMQERVETLQTKHPPKTQEHWNNCLARVKPMMTADALMKYVPPVGPSYSLLRSDGTQAYFYPVDAKFGVACIMTTTNQRVLKPIGVFEHSCFLDDFGGIDLDGVPGLSKLLQKE